MSDSAVSQLASDVLLSGCRALLSHVKKRGYLGCATGRPLLLQGLQNPSGFHGHIACGSEVRRKARWWSLQTLPLLSNHAWVVGFGGLPQAAVPCCALALEYQGRPG